MTYRIYHLHGSEDTFAYPHQITVSATVDANKLSSWLNRTLTKTSSRCNLLLGVAVDEMGARIAKQQLIFGGTVTLLNLTAIAAATANATTVWHLLRRSHDLFIRQASAQLDYSAVAAEKFKETPRMTEILAAHRYHHEPGVHYIGSGTDVYRITLEDWRDIWRLRWSLANFDNIKHAKLLNALNSTERPYEYIDTFKNTALKLDRHMGYGDKIAHIEIAALDKQQPQPVADTTHR